jgi:hypothetical protein
MKTLMKRLCRLERLGGGPEGAEQNRRLMEALEEGRQRAAAVRPEGRQGEEYEARKNSLLGLSRVEILMRGRERARQLYAAQSQLVRTGGVVA